MKIQQVMSLSDAVMGVALNGCCEWV